MDGSIETNEFNFQASLERSNEKENWRRFPFGSISGLVINLQTFEYFLWNSKNAIGSVPVTSPDPPTHRFLQIDPWDMLEGRTVKHFLRYNIFPFPKDKNCIVSSSNMVYAAGVCIAAFLSVRGCGRIELLCNFKQFFSPKPIAWVARSHLVCLMSFSVSCLIYLRAKWGNRPLRHTPCFCITIDFISQRR